MLNKIFYLFTFFTISLAALVLVLLPSAADKQIKSDRSSLNRTTGPILIKHGIVLDAAGEFTRQDIEIRDGRIFQLAPELVVEGAKIINAKDTTIIPGLIDAHTHTFGEGLVEALKFGVTSHIDMFTEPSQLSLEVEKRTLVTHSKEADLFSAGMLATTKGGHGTQFGVQVDTINSPDEAPQWVARRIEEGSDFIKLVYMPYSNFAPSLDLQTASAIIKAGHDKGLQVVAHISSQRAAMDLLKEDIDGFAHIFSDEKVNEEFVQLAKSKDVFIIPTLSVIAAAASESLAKDLTDDPAIHPHLSPDQQRQLESNFGGKRLPGFDLSVAIHNTKILHQAGVTILAGSDAPNPGTTYGASLHQELVLLTRAGLTPREALKAATIKVAKAFKISDRGTITKGMKADLLLLSSNNLDDVHLSRNIKAIYKNGRAIGRKTSDTEIASLTIKSPILSDFSTGLTSPAGLSWSKTDDSMIGGQSTAAITLKNQQLSIDTSVHAGFQYAWAGTGAFAQEPLNISGYQTLEFDIRGASGKYQVMMFSGLNTGTPPSQEFEVDASWRTIKLKLEDFSGFNPKMLNGFAIVAGPLPGKFKYELNHVKLSK